MSYAAVLVHAEAAPEAAPRLRLAAHIANTFDAALIGVGAEIVYPVVVGAFGETMVVAGQEAIDTDLKLAETAFKAAAKEVRKGHEWRPQTDFPEQAIARHSRAADLVVANPRQGMGVGFYSAANTGELLMECGRPILVAPRHMTALEAKSIIVAWKDTRESRRAVSDALPFLKRASQVLLVGICEGGQEADGLKAELQDVAAALARHGVRASTAVRPHPGHGVAQDLMHVAEVQEADLIVAGGYGHSRLREWIFGGVTQEFLTNPGCAVLLSR